MRFIQYAVMATMLTCGAGSMRAAQKSVTASDAVTATATIQAIATANRLVTLKYTDGTVDTVYAGSEVQRFNELKVGDVVAIGTLGLDIYDQAGKQLVWRGSATKTLDPGAKPEKRQQNITKAVAKLLKNFPPPTKK